MPPLRSAGVPAPLPVRQSKAGPRRARPGPSVARSGAGPRLRLRSPPGARPWHRFCLSPAALIHHGAPGRAERGRLLPLPRPPRAAEPRPPLPPRLRGPGQAPSPGQGRAAGGRGSRHYPPLTEQFDPSFFPPVKGFEPLPLWGLSRSLPGSNRTNLQLVFLFFLFVFFFSRLFLFIWKAEGAGLGSASRARRDLPARRGGGKGPLTNVRPKRFVVFVF